jgi:FMN-dependent NADH-azoreductase
MKLLHLDSSILGENSVSRALSAEIVAREQALHPGLTVTYRDLAQDTALHLSGAHLAGLAGNPYLDELFAADIVVIGAPMYNFTVPSQLKSWIDRILVAGKSFRYGEKGAEGLVKNKKIFIASSRGNVYVPGTPAAALEHHETYLKTVLAFIGLGDVTVVRAEGVAFGPEARAAAFARAREQIAAIAA